MPELFGIPRYSIKRSFLELYACDSEKFLTEKYLKSFMKHDNIEAVALELREDRLVCHVEQVIASTEERL